MAARAGMVELIERIRAMTRAGTADHTVAGVAYFTDDQLQDYLDEGRNDYYQATLEPLAEINAGGTTVYQRYYMPDQARWVERAGTGSIFRVYESDGGDPGTANYTVNYEQRNIVFNADTGGTAYYLDFSAYNLNRVAAEVWEKKAGMLEATVDWASDNHRISGRQQVENCLAQARKYRSLAGPGFTRLVRVDEA